MSEFVKKASSIIDFDYENNQDTVAIGKNIFKNFLTNKNYL